MGVPATASCAGRRGRGERTRILDDAAVGGGCRALAVEMEPGDRAVDDAVRGLRESAPDGGAYGVPHALVLYADGKVDPSALRAALGRFNEPPDDGWNWTVEAMAMHLLHGLCGVTEVVGQIQTVC